MDLTLPEWITFCFVQDRVVIFDIKADRYDALSDQMAVAFCALHSGAKIEHLPSEQQAILLQSGLFIVGTNPLLACVAPEASIAMAPRADEKHDHPSLFEPVALQLLAGWRIKQAGLSQALSDVQRRKTALLARRNDTHALPLLEACQAFKRSSRIIPWTGTCLRRSIALVHYLANRHCPASLVIGVRLDPFAAHAWVQHGDIVLNDTLEEVRRYTPIRVI